MSIARKSRLEEREAAEDAIDGEIAARCIAEIERDPDSLLTGEDAEAYLRALIED